MPLAVNTRTMPKIGLIPGAIITQIVCDTEANSVNAKAKTYR